MFDIPSVRIGKVLGIPIEVNLSWAIIFVLLAVSLQASFRALPEASTAPPVALYLVGALTALLFFASVLAHELSHSVVTRLEGGDVQRITLFIFGGVAQIEEEPKTAGREFLMAAAGPAMSLLVSAAFYVGYLVASRSSAEWFVWAPLRYLSGVNLAVAIFNLLPGFPLDGGRVLRSILWGATGDLLKATRWATRSGQAIGWGMILVAVIGLLNGSTGFLWFGVMGWFIAWLAGASYQQQVVRSRLSGLTAEAVMTPSPEYVDSTLSLEVFAHEHLLGGQHSRYPVMHDGAIIGLVSLPDVKSVPRGEWPFVQVLDVTNRDLPALAVSADAAAETLIARLSGQRPGALIVVKEGRMVGLITRADLLDYLTQARGSR